MLVFLRLTNWRRHLQRHRSSTITTTTGLGGGGISAGTFQARPLLYPSESEARGTAAISDIDSYASLLRRCAAEQSLAGTKTAHAHMYRTGFPYLSLGNKLVAAYLKCGSPEDARELFDEMPHPHIVSWNAMVASYVRSGRDWDAIEMYRRMPRDGASPDEFTFSSVLRAFAEAGLQRGGRAVHGHLVVAGVNAANVFVGSALVHMYAKRGLLGQARAVFDRVVDKDVVLATALIAGYAQRGQHEDAVQVFVEMLNGGIRANEFTFSSVLIACANSAALAAGTSIHGLIVKSAFDSGSSSQTSLLVMYSRCSLVDDALKVFGLIAVPNLVARTAVMGVLVSGHREEAALAVFSAVLRDSVNPNAFTFSTALRACSSLALLDSGKGLHALAVKNGLGGDRFVAAALVDVYGKCGDVKAARSVFDSLAEPDLVAVNAMISAYAHNGGGGEAVRLFDELRASGLRPNDATFTGVLSACCSAGLVDDGRRIFSAAQQEREDGPSRDHISCFVDLLGRAGRLGEAEQLIAGSPDVILWRTLLSACKIHRQVDTAERAARVILELSPGDDGTLVLLSNIYASAGRWDGAAKMKRAMRGLRVKKEPAMSWVEVGRRVHTFVAGDRTHHPRAAEIEGELASLIEKAKELGYAADTIQEFDDAVEERRRRSDYDPEESRGLRELPCLDEAGVHGAREGDHC